MPFDFISMLTAIARAIPPLASLCHRLIEAIESYSKKRNEKVASDRLSEKNAGVDAAIDRPGVRSSEIE